MEYGKEPVDLNKETIVAGYEDFKTQCGSDNFKGQAFFKDSP